MIRVGNGTGHLLHIKEMATQVYTMAMIVYDLGILYLIRDLWTDHPGVTQIWYADDAGVGVIFAGIWQPMDNLMAQGSMSSYWI